MSLRIVLVHTKLPSNIGSSARAMKNFGFEELYVVAPRHKLSRKAYALASHAANVLDNAVVCNTLSDALADCTFVLGTTARARKDNYKVYTAREAATHFYNLSKKEKLALVFGREDWGLSNEDLDLCQGYIQILTAEYASLNLAQAVQIVTYEWFHASQEVLLPNSSFSNNPAPREAMERMYDLLLETLHLIKYTDKQRESSAMHLMRRIFDKAQLSKREVSAVHGLWRQVVWAVNHQFKQR